MNSMIEKFKRFVDEITAESGRNYKISVLEKYKDDEDVLYLLDFLYNPYITTGISDKKLGYELYSFGLFDDFIVYKDLKELLKYLETHNTGRDQDIMTVQASRKYFEGYEDLYNRIVTKNIQLGIDAKTINKVIPGFIPEFNVMLANKYFDKPSVMDGKEFAITTKIDGSRIIAMKCDGDVSFWTRQGQKYEGLVDLEAELKACQYDNFVFDGELVAIDTDKDSTYKNTMKLSRTKDLEKHGLKMLVFDYLPVNDFLMQKSEMIYKSRRAQLASIFCLSGFTYFEVLPILYSGRDTSVIIDVLNDQVSKGEEGVMLNDIDAPYVFGRTNSLLKVKKFQDTELKIIGFEEGDNKLTGTLGAFVCEYKGNVVKVGSGLSDDDRAYFWANQDKYLNRYITVKYFEESYDSKTKLPSLRFPIYLRVREDL